MRRAEQLHEEILAQMDLSKEASDEELLELIHRILEEKSKEEFIPLGEKAILGRELFNAFRKLDILQELIEDEEITEIMINGTQPIFIERNGRIYETDKKFLSKGKLEDVVQQMVAGCNRVVNEATPIVDARLEDGSRVNVVLPPVALNGPIVTIRKFPKSRITMETMIDTGSIGKEAAAMLIQAVKAKYNIFISGGTGSGKTTFLNVLSDFIPKEERIITIEDSAELQITGIPNLVRLEARNANVEGTGEINIRDLIRTAAELKPEVLFLALGLNDISGTDGDTDAFIEKYKAVLANVREQMPDAVLYINCVLPVSAQKEEEEPVYAKIPDYNTALKAICDEEGITFIDNTEIVKDEYYEQDGEHMKAEYYPIWAEHMAEVAGI